MTETSVQARPAPAAPVPPAAPGLRQSLVPLLLDVGVPVGGYYLLHDGLGLTLWLSLALSGVAPAVRAVAALVRRRELNLLAAVMVVVNVAGIVVSFATGDPRLMIAKESVISSVIGLAILGSVVLGRPLMSAGLQPFMTRGRPARVQAWDRLAASSRRFRRLERLFSAIWGAVLLADCAARLIGAFTLPVSTMVWLSTVLTISAIGVASLVGSVASGPISAMIDIESGESGRR
jgi:hypothetical protein